MFWSYLFYFFLKKNGQIWSFLAGQLSTFWARKLSHFHNSVYKFEFCLLPLLKPSDVHIPHRDDRKHNIDTTQQHDVKQQTTTDSWGVSSTPALPGRHRSTLTASITRDTTRKRMERWMEEWMEERSVARWANETAVSERVRTVLMIKWDWDTERRQEELNSEEFVFDTYRLFFCFIILYTTFSIFNLCKIWT